MCRYFFNCIFISNSNNIQSILNTKVFTDSFDDSWLKYINTGTINPDPYNQGCNQNFEICGVNVTVRQSCGIVNLLREFPINGYKRKNEADSLVMYPNGEVYTGWLVPKDCKIKETEPCEKVIESL